MTATSSWDARYATGSAGNTRRSHRVEATGDPASGGEGAAGTCLSPSESLRWSASSMTKRATLSGAAALALLLGLAGCTNPYDPGQRAIGGALLGAGTGAAIGAAAAGGHGAALGAAIGGAVGLLGGVATTPPPAAYYPPQAYSPPPAFGAPPVGSVVPPPPS